MILPLLPAVLSSETKRTDLEITVCGRKVSCVWNVFLHKAVSYWGRHTRKVCPECRKEPALKSEIWGDIFTLMPSPC